jgi:hypothetical protein
MWFGVIDWEHSMSLGTGVLSCSGVSLLKRLVPPSGATAAGAAAAAAAPPPPVVTVMVVPSACFTTVRSAML